MMYPAGRTPRAERVPAWSAINVLTPGESNDLPANPRIPATVSVAPQPGKFPAAVLCVISQELANGVAREVTAQTDSLHLILDTTHSHCRPI
jgi:hypothetical protein